VSACARQLQVVEGSELKSLQVQVIAPYAQAMGQLPQLVPLVGIVSGQSVQVHVSALLPHGAQVQDSAP
jgi:hypothetical protein